jgi:hypothetical protein
MRIATRVRWRLRAVLGGVVLSVVSGSGCQTPSNTGADAAVGGGLGALLGAVAGGPRHALAGALIGGGVGAASGAVVGANQDAAQKNAVAQAAAAQAATHNPPMSLEDVAKLTASGTSDELIITQIRTSGTVFYLTPDQVVWLQNQGVRPPVIQEMQLTPTRVGRPVYGQPVYVVQPPPPPPPVGVGVTFVRRW